MRIEALTTAIPSLKVTNDVILQKVAEANPNLPEPLLREYQDALLRQLEDSGSDVRYYRDRARGERASDLVASAIDRCLAEAATKPEDVELFIFCGLSRGYIEPSNASLFAADRGMLKAQCWDLSEACMSYTRALENVDALFRAGRYQNALVVTAELSVLEAADIFKFESLDQLRYSLAALTVGECATATLLTPSDSPWSFAFRSRPKHAGLCRYPVAHHDEYAPDSAAKGLVTREGYFVAYHSEMLKVAIPVTRALIEETIVDMEATKLWIPHATSSVVTTGFYTAMGVPRNKFFAEIYPRYGNLVSSSIPAGLWLAIQEGRIERGDRVVLCPASAGMSFAIVQFDY